MKVRILSKPDCHLCDKAKAVILDVRKQFDFDFEEVDITGSQDLFLQYREEIPVVFIDERKAFKYFVQRETLIKRLSRVI